MNVPLVQPENVVITPHPGQVKVLTSKKRFILAAAGIQGGKTFAGCIWTQLEIQKQPDKDGLICALSYDQLNNVVINKFFNMFPGYKMYFNKKDKTVYLPTGGKIFFRSLDDPKYVEGITAYWAWIDEADLCGYKGYLIVRGRLNATGGRLLMTSSLGDNSWLAEYAEKFDESQFDIISWGSKENPAFSNEEWESLKRELDPALFRRRYEAKIGDASGKVYGRFDKDKHVLDKVPDDDPIQRTMLGIDWGYNDPTAILVVGLSFKKNVYILEDFMVEQSPLDVIIKVVKDFCLEYKANLIYADPSNKMILKEVQAKSHKTILPGNNDIFHGTSIIRNLIFQNRFYVMRHCTHVLKELKLYSFKEGLITRTEEPRDEYNHCMDAMRYPLATYPIPSVRLVKVEAKEPKNDFWLRRTAAYQKEKARNATFDRDDNLIP